MTAGESWSTRATVDELVAAINAHDIDRIVSFYDDNVTNHGVPSGRRGLRRVHELIFTTFPDGQVEVEDVIVTPDRAVARCRLRGTHSATVPPPADQLLFGGALHGVAPAGRAIDVAAIHIWEFAPDGAITAHWAVRDDLQMRLQATGSSA